MSHANAALTPKHRLIVARLVVVPAELPIGIVTATIGAPFFLWLLLRRTSLIDV